MFQILLLISFLCPIFCQKDTEIKLIKDFLQNQIEPNVITAFLCWKKDDLVKLQTAFSEENSLAIIHNLQIDKLNVPFKENQLLLIDLSCENHEKILLTANTSQLFRGKFRWLVLSDISTNNQNALESKSGITQFNNLGVYWDSRVVLAQKTSKNEYTLDYIYRIGIRSGLTYHRLAYWEKEKGFSSWQQKILSRQRQKLGGYALRTSMIFTVNDSLNHLEDYRHGNIDIQLKLNHMLTRYLFEYMNASMEILWDRGWGQYIGNNTWTGLMGRLHRKEVDVAGSALFCVNERMAVYECIAMTTPAKGFFLFRQPPLSYVANIFTLPFETDLWLTNLSFLLVCSLLLYFVVLWEWYEINKKEIFPDYDMISKNFWDSVMFTIGAVCQQGYPTEPKSGSGKIIILTIFFTLIFLFTAFSANTVVLFQSSATSIRTLEDLYNSKMAIGVDDKEYYRYWFPKTTEPVRRKIYYERIAPKGEKPHYYQMEEGIEKMRTEYFAFHIDEAHGYKTIKDTFQEHEKCGLQTIGYLYVSDPWITAPRNSSFKEIYYITYRLLLERGLHRRVIKKLYSEKPECTSAGSNFRSAGILDLYSLYMLFLFGLGGSVILLLFELLNKNFIEPHLCTKYNLKNGRPLTRSRIEVTDCPNNQYVKIV